MLILDDLMTPEMNDTDRQNIRSMFHQYHRAIDGVTRDTQVSQVVASLIDELIDEQNKVSRLCARYAGTTLGLQADRLFDVYRVFIVALLKELKKLW